MNRLRATFNDFEKSEQVVDSVHRNVLALDGKNKVALRGALMEVFNHEFDEMVLTAGYVRLRGDTSELEKLRMDNTMLKWLVIRTKCELSQQVG